MNEKELKFIKDEKKRVKMAKELAAIKFKKEGIRNENKRDVNIEAIQEFGIWEDESMYHIKNGYAKIRVVC